MINPKIRKILKISTELIPKIPTKHDGFVSGTIKILSILDSFSSLVYGKHADNQLIKFIEQLKVIKKKNIHFVDLFFSSELETIFKKENIPLSDYCYLIKASNPYIGLVYFIEWRGSSNTSIDPTFFYSVDFNFELFCEEIWKAFNNKIHTSINIKDRREEYSYKTILNPDDELPNNVVEEIEKFKLKNAFYISKGISRTYLLLGIQGAGKTTFAIKAAQNKRVLSIDANGLTSFNMHNLEFLLDALKPDFVLVDDIDKAHDLQNSLATLLTVLANIKNTKHKCVFVLTANKIENFDPSFLRPERVDQIINFEPPNEHNRLIILNKYLIKYNIQLSKDQINNLVLKTKSLTAAFLKEIAIRLMYDSFEEVLEYIDTMISTLSVNKENSSEVQKTEQEKLIN